MHLRIWLAIGGAALGWGTSSVATRAALAEGVPPIALAAWRSLIALVIVLILIKVTGRKIPTDREEWSLGAMMGTMNLAIPFVTGTIALQYASAGFTGLLIALIPVVTAVLAHFLLPGEPLHVGKVLGLTLGLSGVVFLLVSGDSGIGAEGQPLLAAGLTLFGVLCISYAGIHAKQRQASYDPIVLSGMQFAVGVTLIAVFMLATEGLPPANSAKGWLLIGYMAVVGSVMPFLLFYWVLQRTTTTFSSLTGYLVPLIALVSGIVVLDERLELGIVGGGALILAGVLVINLADRRVQRALLTRSA